MLAPFHNSPSGAYKMKTKTPIKQNSNQGTTLKPVLIIHNRVNVRYESRMKRETLLPLFASHCRFLLSSALLPQWM